MNLPTIKVSGNLAGVADQAWAALLEANAPPTLFRFAGLPSRIERDDKAGLIVRPLNVDRLRYHLARDAHWTQTIRDGKRFKDVEAMPPLAIVRDLLAHPDPPLPRLDRIVAAPCFDGTCRLIAEPGYHASIYYAPADGFIVPSVPETPSKNEIERARDLLFEPLADFPFVSDAERAHAVALQLLPFVRDLIIGSTPLHQIEAPGPGTGKTLLAQILMWPALGRPVQVMTEARDDDEMRKRLTAKLLTGPPVTLIDNIKRRLDSSALSAALTTPIWEDRFLTRSEMVYVPIRCAWICTGNNIALSSEITRRTVRIRMDAKVDRPWERTGFRHELPTWVMEHRADLVGAALTLIQAWITAGRPHGARTLGMFESWSRVMGGILEVAGVPGFMGNTNEFYAASDTETAAWRTLIAAWWATYGVRTVKVSELWTLVNPAAGRDPIPLPIGDGSERSQKTRLGLLLTGARDRVYSVEDGRFRVERAGEQNNAARWTLIPLSPAQQDPAGGAPSKPDEKMPMLEGRKDRNGEYLRF